MKSAFDFSNPMTPVRIIVGLAFIPHVAFKLGNIAGSIAFFAKVGLQPAAAMVWLAIAMESVAAISLVFGILPKWTGFLAAAVMATATFAVLQMKGAVWLWNFGGVEYNVIWMTLCALVSVYAWREEKAKYGRNFLLFARG
ncbi:MAG: DoxX family protein [Methylobacteriaceae bacterium]|nr:DoxX family protein [Methylobacteriaceae bacterium]